MSEVSCDTDQLKYQRHGQKEHVARREEGRVVREGRDEMCVVAVWIKTFVVCFDLVCLMTRVLIYVRQSQSFWLSCPMASGEEN